MIKVDHIEIFNIEGAIRGMRNPLNSWDKSDSHYENGVFIIGADDLDLMKKLYKGGPEHRKYLRQVFCTADVTAPLYWWKEADQYRIGVTTDSCSTMHTIHKKEFELDDFSHEHLLQVALDDLDGTIETLNEYRALYLNDKDKKYWWQMIQLLPSSYNQKRTMTFNYEVAANMIRQRENHKLDEWIEFVRILKNLPYMKEIIGEEHE